MTSLPQACTALLPSPVSRLAAVRLQQPCRVAVVSPEPVVRTGLLAILERHAEVEPTSLHARAGTVTHLSGVDESAPGAPADGTDLVDVVLYDVLGLGDGADLRARVERGQRVIALDRSLRPDLGQRALTLGACVLLPAGVEERELVSSVVQAATAPPDVADAAPSRDSWRRRLGEEHGLSDREIEVLTLITYGLSNVEITRRLYLSINTVKTYIRTAYRRIGATSRSQAVLWCVAQGFAITDPEADGSDPAPRPAEGPWSSSRPTVP
jgi:DNA-binding NarL/FixJ family response regulator